MGRSVGTYLIELLEAYGVDTVFGIPGVHTVELYRGLAASTIRHVTPRHEQGAGFMADGYARVTGRPGVCMVITGPGLSNIATAMLQARADSIPMLVIAGVNDPTDRPRGRLHEMPDQFAFGAQIAAASWRVTEPEQLAAALADAFAVFEGRRPGPVLIEVPLSVMPLDTQDLGPAARSKPFHAPDADPTVLDQAADRLQRSARPAILLGGGGRRAAEAVSDLAHRIDAPIVTTINARTCFASDHKLAVPASASLDPVRALIDESDVVLAVGTELGPTDYDVYSTGRMIAPETLIRIDIDPAMEYGPVASRMFLTGDAERTVRALLERIPDATKGSIAAQRAADARTAAWASLSAPYQASVRLLETLRDTLNEPVLVGDSTQLAYAGCMMFAPGAKAGWFNSSTGFGTLGYALPAAIGAKLGAPDKSVVALIGDGGIQFTLGELGAIGDENAPIVVLVWNNRGYGEIKSFMVERQITPEGVDPVPPAFQKIAEAYRVDYFHLEEKDAVSGLADTIQNAAASPRGAIVEITAEF